MSDKLIIVSASLFAISIISNGLAIILLATALKRILRIAFVTQFKNETDPVARLATKVGVELAANLDKKPVSSTGKPSPTPPSEPKKTVQYAL